MPQPQRELVERYRAGLTLENQQLIAIRGELEPWRTEAR
jgi:hypothetical protein